ncbi:MAG: ankyrin repeat domain-containing protein [Actinobacteria bacterium]|nr:ankyrin repeat domain-containing protein [Actinomycetota bacterium]
MASTRDQLFAAIAAGEVDAARAMLAVDPSLASARDHEGVSALLRARYRSDRSLTEAILAADPEVDAFEAAALGDLDRLTARLAEGPEVHGFSADGFTALHLAAFFGKAEAVRLLVARGADVDARGRGWMTGTPLHSAASGRHADVVEILLATGADPNARQSGGWTPLHSAAHNGDVASVALLLTAGGDVRALNDEGASVMSMAQDSGDAATIAAVRAGVDQA